MSSLKAISIEKATLADSEAIFSLHIDSVTALCASHYTAAQISDWFVGRSPADYTGAIEFGGVWIARIDDELVGFVEVFSGVISMIFVRGTSAGQGIGKQLLDFALGRAKDKGERTIKLEATKNAEGFYQRFGFRTVGEGHLTRASGIELETILMEHDGFVPPMDEYFREAGYEITQLTKGYAPALQQFLEQCNDYFDLIEGKPAMATAAVDELTGGPPERVPNDLFCFGIRASSGEIVGILSAFRDHRRERQWYLSFLLIHPTLRRRRLGRTTYLAFEAWIRSQRADSVLLAVVEANHDGARFWKSLGSVHRSNFPNVKIGLREHLLFEFEKLID